MPSQTATRLIKNTEKILQLWSKRAQKEIGEALPLDKLALRDSLPEYLSQMADALSVTIKRTSKRNADDKLDSTRIGNKHGSDRAYLSKYSIDEVIFEFHLLREVIFQVLEEKKPLPARDRNIILSSIEQAVNDSATNFAKKVREMQKRTIVTLTHDLRTPVSIAKISAELILKNHAEDTTGNFAKKIVANMDRIDLMVDELLDATRIRAGKHLGLEFHQMDLAMLTREICHELKIVFGDRFAYHAKGAIIGFWSEQGLRRLMENLITNAVKYGAKNSLITVTISKVIQGTKIEVHNRGNPIKKDDIPILFDDFERGTDTKGEEGWGIGLALVKAVAEAHKGKIHVESSAKKGTSFVIILPNDFRKAAFGKKKVDFHQPNQL